MSRLAQSGLTLKTLKTENQMVTVTRSKIGGTYPAKSDSQISNLKKHAQVTSAVCQTVAAWAGLLAKENLKRKISVLMFRTLGVPLSGTVFTNSCWKRRKMSLIYAWTWMLSHSLATRLCPTVPRPTQLVPLKSMKSQVSGSSLTTSSRRTRIVLSKRSLTALASKNKSTIDCKCLQLLKLLSLFV